MNLLVDRGYRNPVEKQHIKQNQDAGISTSLKPICLNGSNLLAEEFRDNLHLCYKYAQLDMPQCCDSCGFKLTVEHTLSWNVGGMVHMQHGSIVDNKFCYLCGMALP